MTTNAAPEPAYKLASHGEAIDVVCVVCPPGVPPVQRQVAVYIGDVGETRLQCLWCGGWNTWRPDAVVAS